LYWRGEKENASFWYRERTNILMATLDTGGEKRRIEKH